MKACLPLLITAAAVGSAAAQQIPQQKPGLWETTMVMSGQTVTTQMCLDAAFAATNGAFASQVRKNNHCVDVSITRTPTGWVSTSTCTRANGKAETSRAELVGSLDSRFTMTLRSPPSAPPLMTMTSTLLGPCKPGQKGGDTFMNGQTIHMGEMMKP